MARQRGQHDQQRLQSAGKRARLFVHRSFCLERHVERSVDHKGDKRKNRRATGVPVEDAGVGASPEVRPQWLKEEMVGSKGTRAPRCRALHEEYRQQRARYGKESVEQRRHKWFSDMHANSIPMPRSTSSHKLC